MSAWSYTNTPELTEGERRLCIGLNELIDARIEVEKGFELSDERAAVVLAHLSERLGSQSRRIQGNIQASATVKTYY